ncbi:hypothetical protein IWX78_000822 [Mycetocola sp. CAN_C7]|uniref:DUF4287 domain-containing protein n=1 Tax=Mycetocola sp. CAN_C7 TaxID=2787724 RepID=UPI0018C8DC9D
MSFQAYLDTIETKTGLTPRELMAVAQEREIAQQPVKAADVVDWFATDYGLGRGHAMAFVHVLKNGALISDTHVGTTGTHRDATDELWLDGQATNPN